VAMYGTLTGAAPAPSPSRSEPGRAGLVSEELASVHPLPRGQRRRAG
jgi:hypothetical protein